MNSNPNSHHRKTTRLEGFDYSRRGSYFITICTKNRECLFGHIEDNKMIMNEAGKAAEELWLEIPTHYPNVILHEHIVMPNHVHGIIELMDKFNLQREQSISDVGVQDSEPLQRKPLRPTVLQVSFYMK